MQEPNNTQSASAPNAPRQRGNEKYRQKKPDKHKGHQIKLLRVKAYEKQVKSLVVKAEQKEMVAVDTHERQRERY